MFILFIVLTIVSGVALIVGFVWMLAARGTTVQRSGPEVGAEIMAGTASDDDEAGRTVLEKSVFVGKGVAVERSVEVSYAEIKELVRARAWRAALPVLLAMGGLAGLILFGSLALWVKLDDKLIATLLVGLVLFTMGRIAYDFARA